MFSRKFKKEIKIFIVLVIVAFTVKGSIVEVYVVPTGSMEKEILVGDLLFGNKWIYGMRTPTWLGIPYTRLGFDLPWTRLPEFKELERGDVTIFEYPRDPFQKYVKRCIGVPGDIIKIELGHIFHAENGDYRKMPLPTNVQFIGKSEIVPAMKSGMITGKVGFLFSPEEAIKSKDYSVEFFSKYVKRVFKELANNHGSILKPTDIQRRPLYPLFDGNKDNIKEFVVPFRGMQIDFEENYQNKNISWVHIISLLLQDGNTVELENEIFMLDDSTTVETGYRKFTMIDPEDIAQTAGILKNKIKSIVGIKVDKINEFNNYVRDAMRYNLEKDIYNPWKIEVDQLGLYRNEFNQFGKRRFERYFPNKEVLFSHDWINKKSITHYRTTKKLSDTNDFIYNNLKVNGVNIFELKTYTLEYDYYFMMGDNRNNSSDSRFWGFVNERQILGTPMFSLFNLSKFRPNLKLVN